MDRSAAGRKLHSAVSGRRLLAVALLSLLALTAAALSSSGALNAAGAEPLPQPGSKLPAPGGMLNGLFGSSVSLSADGRTALVSAPGSSGFSGKVLAFTRSGSAWTQQAVLIGSEQIESESCLTESEEAEEA